MAKSGFKKLPQPTTNGNDGGNVTHLPTPNNNLARQIWKDEYLLAHKSIPGEKMSHTISFRVPEATLKLFEKLVEFGHKYPGLPRTQADAARNAITFYALGYSVVLDNPEDCTMLRSAHQAYLANAAVDADRKVRDDWKDGFEKTRDLLEGRIKDREYADGYKKVMAFIANYKVLIDDDPVTARYVERMIRNDSAFTDMIDKLGSRGLVVDIPMSPEPEDTIEEGE